MFDPVAVAVFYTSPLDLDVPIPARLIWRGVRADCTCRATEMQLHAEWCASYGLYAQLCDELVVYPRSHMKPRSDDPLEWHPWRWVCGGFDDWHTGGTINGPAHWCDREKGWVDVG